MGGSTRALNEFVSFLHSPDMYGSMGIAAQMLKWAVHLVVTLLMVAGIIAICIIVLKVAVDILFLSGLANLLPDGNGDNKGFMAKVKGGMDKFASGDARDGDITAYLKGSLWKIVLTLAFIGLLASGMLLPVAGQVASAIGSGVDKLIGLDPASKIANFDFDEFRNSIDYTRATDLKTDYDRYVSDATAQAEQIYELGSSGRPGDDQTIQEYKRLYTTSILKARAVADGVSNTELKLPRSYFQQHRDICKSQFIDREVVNAYGVSRPC